MSSSPCLSGITLTFLHAQPSDFTYNLISTQVKGFACFRLTLPFLVSTLKLIPATFPFFLSLPLRSRRFITLPFHHRLTVTQWSARWVHKVQVEGSNLPIQPLSVSLSLSLSISLSLSLFPSPSLSLPSLSF